MTDDEYINEMLSHFRSKLNAGRVLEAFVRYKDGLITAGELDQKIDEIEKVERT